MADNGLCVPPEVLGRYNFEQSVVVAAIWELYRNKGWPKGELILNLDELFERLYKPNDPETRDELEGVMYSIYRIHRLGYKIEDNLLYLWFPPDMQERIESYKELYQ